MNQSIEDASRREFEQRLRDHEEFQEHMIARHEEDANCYAMNDIQVGWLFWQAARQSSQSEPVANKTLYEFVKCSICTGHGCMKCGSMGGMYKIAAPQHSNALEMAAKVCEGLIAKSLDWDVRVQNDAFKIAADEIRKLITHPESTAPQQAIPSGYAIVPHRLTKEMDRVLNEEDWQWEDLLAAANAITEQEYQDISTTSPTAPIESDK
jgi:hypothetical protein